jgi:hypothetical protein
MGVHSAKIRREAFAKSLPNRCALLLQQVLKLTLLLSWHPRRIVDDPTFLAEAVEAPTPTSLVVSKDVPGN